MVSQQCILISHIQQYKLISIMPEHWRFIPSAENGAPLGSDWLQLRLHLLTIYKRNAMLLWCCGASVCRCKETTHYNTRWVDLFPHMQPVILYFEELFNTLSSLDVFHGKHASAIPPLESYTCFVRHHPAQYGSNVHYMLLPKTL